MLITIRFIGIKCATVISTWWRSPSYTVSQCTEFDVLITRKRNFWQLLQSFQRDGGPQLVLLLRTQKCRIVSIDCHKVNFRRQYFKDRNRISLTHSFDYCVCVLTEYLYMVWACIMHCFWHETSSERVLICNGVRSLWYIYAFVWLTGR